MQSSTLFILCFLFFLFLNPLHLSAQCDSQRMEEMEKEGRLKWDGEDYQAAVEYYRLAIQACPNNIEEYKRIDSYIQRIHKEWRGKLEASQDSLRKTLKEVEEQRKLALRRGRSAQARRLILVAADLPQSRKEAALYLAFRARSELEVGTDEEFGVKRAFSRALAKNPTPPLGWAYTLPDSLPITSFFELANGRFLLRSADQLFITESAERSRKLDYSGSIDSIQVNASGNFFLIQAGPRTVITFDSLGNQLGKIEGHKEEINHVTFASNSPYLITTSRDKTARIWTTAGDTVCPRLIGHKEFVYQGLISSVTERAITRSSDGTVRIWNMKTGAPVATLDDHQVYIYSIALSDDGYRLATASADRTVKVRDLRRLEEVVVYPHEEPVKEVFFVPKNQLLHTRTSSGKIVVWDSPNRKMEIPPEDFKVRKVVYHSEGEKLIQLGEQMRQYDLQSLVEKPRMNRHPSHVIHAEYSPDDRYLLVTTNSDYWETGGERSEGTQLMDPNGNTILELPQRVQAGAFSRFDSSGEYILLAKGPQLQSIWLPELAFEYLSGQRGYFTQESAWIEEFNIESFDLPTTNQKEKPE